MSSTTRTGNRAMQVGVGRDGQRGEPRSNRVRERTSSRAVASLARSAMAALLMITSTLGWLVEAAQADDGQRRVAAQSLGDSQVVAERVDAMGANPDEDRTACQTEDREASPGNSLDHPSKTSFLNNGVTAHRGNSGEFPENTLPAFASAIEIGADWIELDLFRTLDGKLVVIHDRTTGRVGDRDMAVSTSTYEELLEVDVATDFRQRMGLSLEECPSARIPLLEDVLRLVMDQRGTRVSIQPKMDCVAEAWKLVANLGAQPWVGFNDGNLALMSEVKRLAPETPVFWDRGPDTDLEEDLRIARARGFESLVLHHSAVTVDKVDRIQAAGLEAGAWTVNDHARFNHLLDLGVNRIYTDHPRLLLATQVGRRFVAVECDGSYRHHLQGVCADEAAIYWSFTTTLVKTDLAGKVLAQIPVANHHGDLCQVAGKLYVAVNLGKFNRPAGEADSWIYVYDASTLNELARYEVPELVHGAGGMGYHAGKFIVVGGLPEGTEENYLYEYDEALRFQTRHVLPSGWTRLGIQTAAHHDGHWWFGCYGNDLLITDEAFQLVGQHKYDCSLGIESLPDGRLLSAGGKCDGEQGCRGWVKVLAVDEIRASPRR